MAPRVTIITINYNNAAGLQKTLQSVAAQTLRPFQYVVIDGGSKDGSAELLQQNKNIVDEWISEPDNGIYHAMNKGIERAGGDYLLFLNSGDYLAAADVLENIGPHLTADLVYGDILFVKETGNERVCFPNELPFSFFMEGLNSLPHPATFIRSTLFERVGNYNEQHRIVSDWTFFMLALHKYNATFQHADMPVAAYNLEGISSKPQNAGLVQKERNEVLQLYFPTFINDYRRLQQLEAVTKKWRGHLLGKIYSKLFSSSKASNT